MKSKKLIGLLLKLVLFISYYLSKKTNLCLPLRQRFEKNICSRKQILRQQFSEYNRRQLKYYQYRIISKTGISLEKILNVFKCLIVSLVPLKLLLWKQHHFCLFQLASSVNLLWCQVCKLYCPRRKKRYPILPEGTCVPTEQNIHQKDLSL